MARARAVSTASGVAVLTKIPNGSSKNVSFSPNNNFQWMEMVISNHFPCRDLVHHPIETTMKNQASDRVIKHLFVFKFHRFFVRKTPWSTKKKHCVFLIGFLHFFPMKISKNSDSVVPNAGLLGTLRLGCLGIHILTEHLWSIDFRQVTEVIIY